MKGCLKAAVTVTGLVLIVFALISLLGIWQANIWLRGPLETLLSHATGGVCRIDSVQIHPLVHSIELSGISLVGVGLPRMGASLSASRIVLFPDANSLITGMTILRQVNMEGSRIEFELGATPDLTLLVLDAWVKYLGAGREASIVGNDGGGTTTPAMERRFTIRGFHCDGIQLAVKGASTDAFVPAFDITGVGEQALTVNDLTHVFLRKVIEKAVESEGDTNPLTSALGKILKLLSSPEKNVVVDSKGAQ